MLRYLLEWMRRSENVKRIRRKPGTRRCLRAETLDKRQLLAANIFHNESMPEDVNEDGVVSAIDALTVINQLSLQEQGSERSDGDTDLDAMRGRRTDVNDDGRSSAMDALMVINRLHRDRDGNRPVVERPADENQADEKPADENVESETDDVSDEETDVVLEWNDVFGEILADSTENQNPGYASRSQAILNLAIYDAVAIATAGASAETFYDYAIDFTGAESLDTDVAAAQAAYTVLSSLYPDQQASLDMALQSNLSGAAENGNVSDSVALGTAVANEILALRAEDGFDAAAEYTYTDEVGYFQPDPLTPDVPVWGPAWGEVDTFAIDDSGDFLPEPTPGLDSEQYAQSYNEVLELGAADSDVRTPEQTEIGIFWAYDRVGLGTPIALFNDILQTVAIEQDNTLEENAALFAQASVAMADAGVVAWDTKFTEQFWRPVTAIQAGDADGNELTEGDADWVALGAPDGGDDEIGFTPQFPTYISGHATFGAALFGTLQEFYGTDEIAFEVTSQELEILLADPELQEAYGLDLDDATRSFSSFSEAMQENGRSRIYLGIHFDFDDTVGQEVGQAIAASVASEFTVAFDDGNNRDKITGNDRSGRHSGRDRDNDRIAAVDSVFGSDLF
ncbi:dockerin type I domain-containing protein [Roseiconus lacunae]|uniref:Dockerin type I domain-containing protein n=2 Tax=Roseiconus lacunae TaxID=2605694 RepID=A0ABT7PKC7_9BACT|nr:dockerin type I domain-containing protein [Roseiconus lacunae]MDM4016962.1 dockerin type I domain-containing protein [Roseiconus lacunae]